MAVSGSWISFRKFVVLCLVLTILLLSTNIFLSFDDDETFFDEGGEVIQSWSVDAVGIKETEDKIFNFLEVDENWNERYSEGGHIADCTNLMFRPTMIFKYLYVVGLPSASALPASLYARFLLSPA